MHSSSLVNAAYIWGSETASVGELLKGDHPLAAMATLMFSPHKLQQVSVRCNFLSIDVQSSVLSLMWVVQTMNLAVWYS